MRYLIAGILLLLASPAWAGPEIFLNARGVGAPPSEYFTADADGWSGTGFSWQATGGQSGGYMQKGSATGTLSKAGIVFNRAVTMTVYGVTLGGSCTVTANSDGSPVGTLSLSGVGTWTKSSDFSISQDTHTIDFTAGAGCSTWGIDTIEFR